MAQLLPDIALALHVKLQGETDSVTAVKLAFKLTNMVPDLVGYIKKLEELNSSVSKSVTCKCEWCGDEFKVFQSELKLGRKTGRYCSRACYFSVRSEQRQDRDKSAVEFPTGTLE